MILRLRFDGRRKRKTSEAIHVDVSLTRDNARLRLSIAKAEQIHPGNLCFSVFGSPQKFGIKRIGKCDRGMALWASVSRKEMKEINTKHAQQKANIYVESLR